MKRQLLSGRFGLDDTAVVATAADEQRTWLQLVAGEKSLDHGIGGALTSLKKLGIFPSEIGIDLLVVAAHVHAADTRISRAEQSQDSWTREIRLVVPVSDPVRWTAATPTLTKALNFLTGDRWTIGFRARPPRFTTIASEAPPTLIAPPFDSVSLFSGWPGQFDRCHRPAAEGIYSTAGQPLRRRRDQRRTRQALLGAEETLQQVIVRAVAGRHDLRRWLGRGCRLGEQHSGPLVPLLCAWGVRRHRA